jgi:predicted acylesterase/phospholipase RssA
MTAKKRSLILAGGGLKVAFQAGVLQVWLDEAGLTFDHADGASGGTLNLAMYCQGMTGTEIADAWRRTNPLHGADIDLVRLLRGDALLTMDRYRSEIFPMWGLDWSKIRATAREATFNVCNFGKFELEVIEPRHMSEDLLIAGVSLPMWFPPVEIDGQTYLDAVYLSDGNLEEAIRRGADEIWVIWTVSERGVWDPGFTNIYFQIIEIAANGHFRRVVRRVQENNAAIVAGRTGEFGRRIELKVLRAEVPVHYLLNVGQDRLHEAVNRGIQAAREWCTAEGVPLRQPARRPEGPPPERVQPSTLSFSEVMKGFVGLGALDFEDGFRKGRGAGTRLEAHLAISIDDIDGFVTLPEHEAAVTGHVDCDALEGKLRVDHGTFNLLVDEGTPERKQMNYRLLLRDPAGKSYTFVGTKVVADDPEVDVWADTTTLYTRVLDGAVVDPSDDDSATVVASGIISIHLLDFLHQLTTFQIGGPPAARPAALARFGKLFLGKLSEVYAQRILPWGPV